MWLKFPCSVCQSLIFPPPFVEKTFLQCMFLAPLSTSDDDYSGGQLLGPLFCSTGVPVYMASDMHFVTLSSVV